MPSKGLAFWASVAQRPDEFIAAALELTKHPRFEEAGRRSVANAVLRHTARSFADFPSQDIFRLYYALFIVYLDLTGEVTRTRIEKFCAELGLASPGRVAAILRHLERIGYVALDPLQADRRSRRYRPTPALIEDFGGSQISELETLALLEPEAEDVIRNFYDPAGFRAYVLGFSAGIVSVIRQRDNNALSHFSDRNGGMGMLLEVMATAEEGDTFPPQGPLRISLAGLAKQMRLSRNHAFRLFKDAEAKGLLRRDGRFVWLGETLRFQIALFFALLYAGLAGCGFLAIKARRASSSSAEL